MAELHFLQDKEVPSQNNYTTLEIPNQGELPVIPFGWTGSKPQKATAKSIKSRDGFSEREFTGVLIPLVQICTTSTEKETESVKIIWVDERAEWIAYKSATKVIKADNKEIDEFEVFIDGPWSLDETHKRALLQAFHVDINNDVKDIHKFNPTLLCHLEAESIFYLMQEIERPTLPYPEYRPPCRIIIEDCNAFPYTSKENTIKLAGWHFGGLDGEAEYQEENRETYLEGEFGQGVLIYQGQFDYQGQLNNSICKVVEIWRQKRDIYHHRFIMIAFEHSVLSGNFGINQSPGTLRTWAVIGLRILPWEKSR